VFAEAVEFARIEEAGSDPDTAAVRAQLRRLRAAGHEIALHLHPWWASGRYEGGQWQLEWTERNICSLPPDRVEAIVSNAIAYLRAALDDPAFAPFSFRSGLWAMQPTQVIANTLIGHGIRLDSSVFRGGRIHSLGLDYRSCARIDGFWNFSTDVAVPDPYGALWELSGKRVTLHNKVPRAANGTPLPRGWRDYLRLLYPRKLDFCRMTFDEMRETIERVLSQQRHRAEERSILVAIGHSKDFVDADDVRRLLEFFRRNAISVTTFCRAIS
jgi:hypothetical protein